MGVAVLQPPVYRGEFRSFFIFKISCAICLQMLWNQWTQWTLFCPIYGYYGYNGRYNTQWTHPPLLGLQEVAVSSPAPSTPKEQCLSCLVINVCRDYSPVTAMKLSCRRLLLTINRIPPIADTSLVIILKQKWTLIFFKVTLSMLLLKIGLL